MKVLFIHIVCSTLFFINLNAHELECGNADPKAKLILDAIASEYLSHRSVSIEFTLSIELAEKAERNEAGLIIQSDDKFRVEMKEQDIYCDGNSLWYYIKSDNEVQINDYEGDEDVGVISPRDLLNQYESGQYEYALVNETSEKGELTAQIEFKPKDDYSDYSKLRVSINKNTNSITRVIAFGKDGSRYTMTVVNEEFDKNYDAGFFVFDSEKFPGLHIEDLRLD